MSHVRICSSFRIVFIPSYHVLLPPGVMLHMHCNMKTNLEIAPLISKKCIEKVCRARVN